MIMMTIVQRYMGISAALLLIIPLVIIVRILVKKSRWSFGTQKRLMEQQLAEAA